MTPVLNRPGTWGCDPGYFADLTARVKAGKPLRMVEKADGFDEYCREMADEEHGYKFDEATGIVTQPVSGIICQGCGPAMEYCWGFFDTNRLHALCAFARSDSRVRLVVLKINSPGGYVPGVHEAALDIESLPQDVIARVDGMAASCGYWVAASADFIDAAPSAEVLSVGVSITVYDDKELFGQSGIKAIVVRDGDLKAMDTPGKGWTEKEVDFLKKRVAKASVEFKGFVVRRRGLHSEDMQGQSYPAKFAPPGSVDSIEHLTYGDFERSIIANLAI